jgi:hypothetical protein
MFYWKGGKQYKRTIAAFNASRTVICVENNGRVVCNDREDAFPTLSTREASRGAFRSADVTKPPNTETGVDSESLCILLIGHTLKILKLSGEARPNRFTAQYGPGRAQRAPGRR